MSGECLDQSRASDATEVFWEFFNDLATISSYAAGEVHGILKGREGNFEALKRLVGVIRSGLLSSATSTTPQFSIDPTTAVAMNHALDYSYPDLKTPERPRDELIRQSERIATMLEDVARNPTRYRDEKPEELERLRSLCLALSNSALACEEPIDDLEA